MTLLLLGLLLLFGPHVLTTLRGPRAALVARLGERRYRGLYALATGLGLVLIVVGYGRYRAAGYVPVYDDTGEWRYHVALALMWPAMVLITATFAAGQITRRVRHPMLLGVGLWALAHLIANGDLGSLLLFGSFLAFALYDRLSLARREARGEVVIRFGSWRNDVVAVAVGTVLYMGVVFVHPIFVGRPVLTF